VNMKRIRLWDLSLVLLAGGLIAMILWVASIYYTTVWVDLLFLVMAVFVFVGCSLQYWLKRDQETE
jgi:hypothetical protein